MADSGLTDILQAQIKVILKTEVRDTFDQTLNAMDKVILLKSNCKGALGSPNSEINGKKEDMATLGDIESNFELSKERLFQSFPKSMSATILAIEIQELAYKIT